MSRKGVVNDNVVVHSAVLGAEVGAFSFNWIGLINKASGLLAMIVHAPIQQKLKTADGQQGNVLTRSFLMEFDDAQVETGINTPAETWQIDFTARMAGMDERPRRENVDIYGAAAFFGDDCRVGKTCKQFFITKGGGYVAGLRAELVADQNITVTDKPTDIEAFPAAGGTVGILGVTTPPLTVTKKASFNSMVKMLGEGKNNNGEVRSAGSLFYPYGDMSDQSVEFYAVEIVNSHLEVRVIVNKADKGRYFRFKDDGSFLAEGECQAGNGQARLAQGLG